MPAQRPDTRSRACVVPSPGPANDARDEALLRLRAIGQRVTTCRLRLLESLHELGRPVTIPAILEHQRDLAQSSVYRNLTVLEQAGLVAKIGMGTDHARYELSEALTGVHHHHLVCTDCGDIVDVALPRPVEQQLTAGLAAVAAEADFQLEDHRLDILGRCSTCARQRPRR